MDVKKMIQNPNGEHALNGLKALAAGIPIVGGPINSLMTDYLPDYKYKRLEKFLKELSEKFENYTGENNEGYITSEEFGYLFEETMKKASIEYREEKLLAYKNFLYKSMVNLSIENEKKEYFLGMIDKLNYYHLIILRIFYSPEIVIDEFNIDIKKIEQGLGGSLFNIFEPLIRGYDIPKHIWENILTDVEQMGLIKDTISGLNIMISRANLQTLKERQSLLGQELYSFIGE